MGPKLVPPLLLLLIASSSTSKDALEFDDQGPKLCHPEDGHCEGDDCNLGQICVHGSCNKKGRCQCGPCFSGPRCDKYEDASPATFPINHDEVVLVPPFDSGPIYKAPAIDSDFETSCIREGGEVEFCPCGRPHYVLLSGRNLVRINSTSGELSLKDPDKIPRGQFFEIEIALKGYVEENDFSPPDILSTMQVVLFLEKEPFRLGPPVIHQKVSRRKREIEESPSPGTPVVFDFQITDGENNKMELANQVDFRLDIYVPKTEGVDIFVEIFTRDYAEPEYNPVLAIFNFAIKEEATIQYLNGKPRPDIILNQIIDNVCERAVMSFGVVSNTAENSTISITFSVTMVRNAVTKFGKLYYVTAGGEFENHTYVWVGQHEIKVIKSKEEKREVLVDVVSPDSIALDSSGLFTLDAYLSIRSDPVVIELLGRPSSEDVYSVSHLTVAEFGSNFGPVPQDVYHYNRSRTESNSEMTFKNAFMDMGLLTNIGKPRVPTKHPANKIQFRFSIYLLNSSAPIPEGAREEVYVEMRTGTSKLWSARIPFNIAPMVPQKPLPHLSSSATADVASVAVDDLVVYTVLSNLTGPGYVEYSVEVPAASENGDFQLEPCSGHAVKARSGYNVPYVNFSIVEAAMTQGNKHIFRFGRIHVTNQVPVPGIEDNMLVVNISFTLVSTTPESKPEEGKELSQSLTIVTSGQQENLVLPSVTIGVRDHPVPEVKLVNTAPWNTLYQGGAVVMNLSLSFLPRSGYSDVLLEVIGSKDTEYPDLHICRVNVVHVGQSLPCLYLETEHINSNFTEYKDWKSDNSTDPANQVLMHLGTVSSVSAEIERPHHAELRIQVAAQVPEDTAITKTDTSYPLSLGISFAKTSVWTSQASYPLVPNVKPQLQQNQGPEVTVTLTKAGPFRIGQPVQAEVIMQTHPMSVGQYAIRLASENDQVYVCHLRVKSVGDNLPCADRDKKAHYTFTSNKKSNAVINFRALSNLGLHPQSTTSQLDGNTVVFSSVLLLTPKAQGERPVAWNVEFAGGKELTGTLILPLSSQASEEQPVATTGMPDMKVTSSSAYASVSVPLFLTVELAMEPYSVAPLVITIANSHPSKAPFEVCKASMIFIGQNYPCLKEEFVKITVNSSTGKPDGVGDTVTFDLGTVCHTHVTKDPKENKVKMRVTIRPLKDAGIPDGEAFTVLARASTDKESVQIGEVTLTMVMAADEQNEFTTTSVKPLVPVIPFTLRQRSWTTFNLTMPPEEVVKVTILAEAPVDGGRAVLTVHGFRVVSSGINIPCAPEVVGLTTSSAAETGQFTKMDIDLGFIANTGYTHGVKKFTSGDDDITFEMQIELTDHPTSDYNSQHSVTATVQVGGTTLEGTQTVEVKRTGQELAIMTTTFALEGPRLFQKSEQFLVSGNMKLSDNSDAEPAMPKLQMFLPPYMIFDSVSVDNISDVLEPEIRNNTSWLEIEFPYLLFENNVKISLTFLVDPHTTRGFGAGQDTFGIIHRVICKYNQQLEAPENSAKVHICGETALIPVRVNSAECYNPLGLQEGGIEDCQLSASSAVNERRSPKSVRLGSEEVWSPALWSPYTKEFLQIDFLHLTRVTRLVVASAEDYRRVTKYSLSYSLDGENWLQSSNGSNLNYVEDRAQSDVAQPFQARFMRFTIEETQKEKVQEQYVGLQLEVFGCYIKKEETSTCEGVDSTWFGEKTMDFNRHFSVDTERNILYLCDIKKQLSQRKRCFFTADAGISWHIVNWDLGQLLGFDQELKMTVATDQRHQAYLGSTNGYDWVALTKANVSDSQAKSNFLPSVFVPPFVKEDLAALKLVQGKWKATYLGMHYENSKLPLAQWM